MYNVYIGLLLLLKLMKIIIDNYILSNIIIVYSGLANTIYIRE